MGSVRWVLKRGGLELKRREWQNWSPWSLVLVAGLSGACGSSPSRDAEQAGRELLEISLREDRRGFEAHGQAAGAEEALAEGLERPSSEEVRGVLWRSGRLLLAGLPAVRSTQRAAQSERAQARLRAALGDPGPLGSHWKAEITSILQQPYTGQDDIWSASARAMGRLGNREFAALIAHGLDGKSFPGRVEAAREALHELFGVWFRSETEFEPYLSASASAGDQQLLLKSALENERVARERLIKLFGLQPSLAREWMDAIDPLVRIAAAGSLGASLKASVFTGAEREELQASLFARLEQERDPRAYHALVSALSLLTETQRFDAPAVLRLRRALVGQRAGMNTLARAQAMARLPWRMEGELGEDHIYQAVMDMGGLIGSMADMDRRRGSPDPDPMIESLVALQILCDRATGAGLGPELRELEVRSELIELISAGYYPDSVRVAACDAFGAFMLTADQEVLKAVLQEEEGLPALRYGVLGLIHSLLLKWNAGDAGSAELIELVMQEGGANDPDLRRRALSILRDPKLKPLIQKLEPSYLVRRFVEEDVPDLALAVLGLLMEFGEPEILPACMASERFEALAADPESLPALTRMCIRLAAGDAQTSLQAARHLARNRRESASLARLQKALELIAALGDAAALELDSEGQRQVCAWAWELQVQGVSLASVHKLPFLRRLARTHWPRSGPEVNTAEVDFPFDEPARKHFLAILLGIEANALTPEDARYGAARVEATQAFASAARSAGEHRGRVFGADLLLEVRRDQARFLYASNQWEEALEQFSLLVAHQALALPDLRTAIEILTTIDDGTGRAEISEALFELQSSAIAHPTWHAEPLALRMQDLRELSTSAMENPGGAHSQSFVQLLKDLPPLPSQQAPEAPESVALGSEAPAEPGDDPQTPPGAQSAQAVSSPSQESDLETEFVPLPVWSDLVLDEGRLEELHELRRRHLDAIARLQAKPAEASALLD